MKEIFWNRDLCTAKNIYGKSLPGNMVCHYCFNKKNEYLFLAKEALIHRPLSVPTKPLFQDWCCYLDNCSLFSDIGTTCATHTSVPNLCTFIYIEIYIVCTYILALIMNTINYPMLYKILYAKSTGDPGAIIRNWLGGQVIRYINILMF